MRDSVQLQIGSVTIENFLSYSIASDIYTADDAFSVELGRPEFDVPLGSECTLKVNGVPVMSGIVDSVTKSYSKSGRSYSIAGRDLMSLAVDSYCENFISLAGKRLADIAKSLFETVPILNRKPIVYDAGIERLSVPATFEAVSPGQTVFQVLRDIATSRGVLFYCRPDGTIVFSRPKNSGPAPFSVRVTAQGNESGVIEGRAVRSCAQHYRKIIVIGQKQGGEDDSPEDINILETITDDEAPIAKTIVVTTTDGEAPQKIGAVIKEQNRYQAYQYEYTFAGHTQRGHVWRPEMFCQVFDDELSIQQPLYIYGCDYSMSKSDGVRTTVRMGLPGVMV
jgi:prophage tail gpP-like protein